MSTWGSELAKAQIAITNNDHTLRLAIASIDYCSLQPHLNYYQELVESIVGQQLSIKAASSINKRFIELFGGTFPAPEAILQKSVDELKAAGLSGRKASYIIDLAQHVVDGRITFDNLDNMSNDEIIAELTKVKGIGEWTVHMFLIFAMGRLNVLAHGDLGVRTAIKNLYGFDKLPTPDEVKKVAIDNNWAPYESVACWYLWQSLKLQK